jgi:hypothetical protein
MDTNWHQKEPSRALKLQIYGEEISNWAKNEKWYKNDKKCREGQNFDIISYRVGGMECRLPYQYRRVCFNRIGLFEWVSLSWQVAQRGTMRQILTLEMYS